MLVQLCCSGELQLPNASWPRCFLMHWLFSVYSSILWVYHLTYLSSIFMLSQNGYHSVLVKYQAIYGNLGHSQVEYFRTVISMPYFDCFTKSLPSKYLWCSWELFTDIWWSFMELVIRGEVGRTLQALLSYIIRIPSYCLSFKLIGVHLHVITQVLSSWVQLRVWPWYYWVIFLALSLFESSMSLLWLRSTLWWATRHGRCSSPSRWGTLAPHPESSLVLSRHLLECLNYKSGKMKMIRYLFHLF